MRERPTVIIKQPITGTLEEIADIFPAIAEMARQHPEVKLQVELRRQELKELQNKSKDSGDSGNS